MPTPLPVLLGAHVGATDPWSLAAARGADVVQLFLSSPRAWAPPRPRGDAETLRDAGPLFVHASYLAQACSAREDVRAKTLASVQATLDAAADIGALGVVVHGGHGGKGTQPSDVIARWRHFLERLETPCRLLIENTASGDAAAARYLWQIESLWELVERHQDRGLDIGFCLDSAHAAASGDLDDEDVDSYLQRLTDIVGRIDLVHLNDLETPVGSARDRHANLGHGTIPEEWLVRFATAARHVLVETPGGEAAQAADIAWARKRL